MIRGYGCNLCTSHTNCCQSRSGSSKVGKQPYDIEAGKKHKAIEMQMTLPMASHQLSVISISDE